VSLIRLFPLEQKMEFYTDIKQKAGAIFTKMVAFAYQMTPVHRRARPIRRKFLNDKPFKLKVVQQQTENITQGRLEKQFPSSCYFRKKVRNLTNDSVEV
jgi:hypothetical protein